MRCVLGIVYSHENNALLQGTLDYCYALSKLGYHAEAADVSTSAGVAKLDAWIKTGELEFCFGIQGVGSNLTCNDVNLWTYYKIPFIALHYDNPCYNIHNHNNPSPLIANLYFSEYFLDVQNRYIGKGGLSRALPFQMTNFIHEPFVDFADRTIRLCYIKSGGRIDEYREYFNRLPLPLRDGVYDLLKHCEKDPNLHVYDMVDRFLLQHGYDRRVYQTQFWAVVQAIDFYLRRKRAIDFVNWLKFQEGALIIGEGWDFIDKTGARAEFRSVIPPDQVLWVADHTQFFCNTNPYGRDIVHERIVVGLFKHCCVVSDTNAWWDEYFPHVDALVRFSFDRSLDDQLLPIIQNIPDAATAAAKGRYQVQKQFENDTNIGQIISCAEHLRQNIM